jgi:hypothetical protein
MPVRVTVKQGCLQIVLWYVRGATPGVPTLKFNMRHINILDPYIKKKGRILNLCCKSCSPFLPQRKQNNTSKQIKFPLLLHFPPPKGNDPLPQKVRKNTEKY